MMSTTVQKWGTGLGIRLPGRIAERVKLTEGTPVDFDPADGVLTIRPKPRRRYTLAKLLAAAKGPSPHRAAVRGAPVGRELL